MTVILNHQTENVTLGVLDKAIEVATDLHLVTFLDVLGSVHSVFAHKEGPFQTADDVVRAFESGYLHPFATHEEAVAHATATGDHALAERVARLIPTKSASEPVQVGGGF